VVWYFVVQLGVPWAEVDGAADGLGHEVLNIRLKANATPVIFGEVVGVLDALRRDAVMFDDIHYSKPAAAGASYAEKYVASRGLRVEATGRFPQRRRTAPNRMGALLQACRYRSATAWHDAEPRRGAIVAMTLPCAAPCQ
jgi:hypothetical protein